MKILFYLNPQSDHEKKGTLAQWASWFMRLDRAIESIFSDHYSIFYVHASSLAYFSNSAINIFPLEDYEVNQLIKIRAESRCSGSFQAPKEIPHNLLPEGFTPEVIIALDDAQFFQGAFPDAAILHVEMSPYYRLLNQGIRFCVNFTDRQKTSDIKNNFDIIKKMELPPHAGEVIARIRHQVQLRYSSEEISSKFKKLRVQYEKICIVPLAEPTFSPLNVEVYSILEALLLSSDDRELFLAVDHPLAKALNSDQIIGLKRRYSNFLMVDDVCPGTSSQSMYLHCDVVYGDFSNAALDSLMFDNITYRSAVVADLRLKNYENFRNALNSTLVSMTRNDSEKIIYFLLKLYHLHAGVFFNPEFWRKILNSDFRKLSFADIEARLVLA